MAIKAYNAGTNNNIIDTSEKFSNGDTLIFDIDKNLFVRGIKFNDLATIDDIDNLQSAVTSIEWAKVINAPDFITSSSADTLYASTSYVDSQVAAAVTGGQIDLDGFVTEQELVTAITNANYFSGSYNDLADVPTLFDGDFNSLINTPTLFDGNYSSLTNPPILFSGSFDDLTNKPTLFSGDYNDLYNKPVVFSGNYNDLYNVPTVPSDVSHLADASNLLGGSSSNYDNLTNKPTIPTDVSHLSDSTGLFASSGTGPHFSGDYNDLTNQPTIFSGSYDDLTDMPVMFSGIYADLVGKPSIPVDISELTDTTDILGQSFNGNYESLSNKPTLFDGAYDNLTNKPNLFSGSYDDLINKPAIPSILLDLNIVDGTNGQVLTTDGTGGFTFTTIQPGTIINNIADIGDVSDSIPSTGQVLKWDGSQWTPSSDTTGSGGAGIGLGDLSITTAATPSGNGSLAYDNTLGVFTYTPADIGSSNFSGDFDDLTNKPTLFDGNYNSLIGKPTPFSGSYTDLSDKPTITAAQTLTFTNNTLYISDGNSVDLSNLASGGSGSGSTDGLTSNSVTSTLVLDPGWDFIPATDAQQCLGSSTNRWTDIYIDDSTINIGQNVLQAGSNNELIWNNQTVATTDYVTAEIASVASGGQIDLDGYATESYVDQKLVERGHHFSGDYNALVNLPVLFSGDYNDLLNKPASSNDLVLTLAGSQLQLVDTATDPDTSISSIDLSTVTASLDYTMLGNLPNLFSGDYNDLVNRPNLFSGDYNDLSNQPYIPSIAGLASEQYVNNKHAEGTLYGDKLYTGSVTYEDFRQQKTSIVSHTANKRELVLAIQTTSAIPTEVLLSDSSRIEIAQNSTAMFSAMFVCASSSSSASFNIRGIINHSDAGIVQLIGSNITEILADEGDAWSADITADNTNNSLTITVTGSETTTVDWTIFCELSEVIR